MAAVIGALRAELSASIAQFESDMGRAANAVGKFSRAAQKTSQQISAAGRSMTFGITAPVVAFGVAAAKTAGDFEAAMNRVEAATSGTAKEMKALTAQARAFGRDKKFTATAKDAADAMETLAKNGLSVTDILGGAEEATLKLSAATGANFNDSADVATGAMQQFGKQAGDLGKVVDQVTGVLLVSKFGFDDYRLAMGQAGGAAGGLGVTLEDFNTAIAATSALFASGSDAGTSFKTFLQRLNPQSKQAAAIMKQFGLEFFDSTGQMKSMSVIAELLKTKLGNLSDEAKSKALTEIFGTDAMRTAIGLMNQGADGFERLQAAIAKASASKQMEARMKGLNGSMQQLRKQVEALFLRVAESGFLDWVTGIVNGLTNLAGALAQLPGPVLAIIAAIAGIAAAVGPALVAIGWMVGALANLAPLLPLIGGALATVATFLLGPWGVAIAAAVAVVLLFKDQILALIGFLVGEVQRLLGPTFQKIMADFARIWTALSTGPVGAAIGFIIKAIGNLGAIIGAVLGEIVLRVLAAMASAFESALHVVTAVIEAISKLLSGDFAGAWASAKEAVGAAIEGIMGVLDVFLPGATAVIKAVYEAVKKWIGDGIAAVLTWIEGRFPGLVAAMSSAFTAAIGWAKNLYTGIKTWIVDNLGPMIKWAIDRINDLQGAFAAIRGEQAKTAAAAAGAPAAKPAAAGAPSRPAAGPKPPKANPNVQTFRGGDGGGGGGAGGANAVKAATEKYAEAIRDLNDKVAKGLDERELPRSVARAEELRRKIADIGQDAKDSGVNVNMFGGQIGALRDQIAKLETVGLAKEAEQFALEVGKDQRAVDEFARNGLPPLEQALQEVDDKYQSLHDRIQADIDANAVLAEKNADAAASMATLEQQLIDLGAAHDKASEGARKLYEIESRLADLKAAGDLASTQNEIADLQQASGRNGIMGKREGELQAIQRDLDAQRIAAATKLGELQGQREVAEQQGDEAALLRLGGLIESQTQLYNLVNETTALQIERQSELQGAWDDLADGLSKSLADMLVNWKFDLNSLKRVFQSWASDFLSKQIRSGLDGLAGFAKKGLSSMLSGSFGGGGGIELPPFAHGGQWNVGGLGGVDRNVVAFRATNTERVTVETRAQQRANDAGLGMGGGVHIGNIVLPNVHDERSARRYGKVVAAEIVQRGAMATRQGVK